MISLDVPSGVYRPDYRIQIFSEGNPKLEVKDVDLNQALSIQTSKSLNDISGTFTLTLKDGSGVAHYSRLNGKRTLIKNRVAENDVVLIALRGHDGITHPVLHGLVDRVTSNGSADTGGGSENTVIEGRCMGKYLQITYLFLPVWDPRAPFMPTGLLYGLGGKGFNPFYKNPEDMPLTPRGIFGDLARRFVFGQGQLAGESGLPAARHWLDIRSRFGNLNYNVPYLQFNEDAMASVLKSLEILGFTEAWVDETGNVVYRHPQWDAPATYSLSTDSLISWNFDESDDDLSTYVEVTPTGTLLTDAAFNEALMAGRAPVPKSYMHDPDGKATQLGKYVSREFVIDTDRAGKVTAKGRRNFWYRLQRKYGVRIMSVTSPLLANQQQAQMQAEGLLRFFSRFTKTAQLTIPGQSVVRLGHNIVVHGEVDGVRMHRGYYIEGVQHEYTEGEGYRTTLQLTHGRDPWDRAWQQIVIPSAKLADVVAHGGTLQPPSDDPSAPVPKDAPTITSKDGYALPLDQRYMLPLGDTDDGVDIENAPDGATVFSITPGVVSAVNTNDPSGFGPAYPVVRASSGPYKGSYIYYGHVAKCRVRAGDPVRAGQAIATVGHTGDAASMHHGHIEIGFSDKGGNPLNHHAKSGSRSTPMGVRMRKLLNDLIKATPAL